MLLAFDCHDSAAAQHVPKPQPTHTAPRADLLLVTTATGTTLRLLVLRPHALRGLADAAGLAGAHTHNLLHKWKAAGLSVKLEIGILRENPCASFSRHAQPSHVITGGPKAVKMPTQHKETAGGTVTVYKR